MKRIGRKCLTLVGSDLFGTRAKAARLCAKARECEELALQVKDGEAREDLLLVARQWRELADRTEN
jgi:hypothetical protein